MPAAFLDRSVLALLAPPTQALDARPESTEEDVAKAYRRLALRLHPDKCGIRPFRSSHCKFPLDSSHSSDAHLRCKVPGARDAFTRLDGARRAVLEEIQTLNRRKDGQAALDRERSRKAQKEAEVRGA